MDSDQQHPGRADVLVVDSDGSIRVLLHYLFEVVCHRSVKLLSNCTEGAQSLTTGPSPEVVVVDCYGAKRGHLDLIQTAAALKPKPLVIAVDHESTPKNGVSAFLAGADDVVRLPFTLKEFALRLRVRMKAAGVHWECDVEGDDDWDAEAHVAHQAGLTTVEAQVLRVLICQDGRTVSRDELSRVIDDRPWDYGDRKFDVHVAKIRKKLDAAFGDKISVLTVRSAGYQLTVAEKDLHLSGDNRE